MVTLVLPAIIYCALWVQPQNISRRLFIFLGSISYAVYTLHAPLGSLIANALMAWRLDVAAYSPWSGCLFLLFFILVCWTIDKFYDTPIRNCLAKLVPRRARPQHQAA